MKSLFVLALVAGALYFGPSIILVAAALSVVAMGLLGLLLILLTIFI